MTDPTPLSERVYLPLVQGTGGEPPPTSTPTPSSTPSVTPTSTPSGTPTATPTATPTSTAGPPQRVAIDPITRIEGHLRIEVQIEDGRVVDAWSAGMMFRGIELLLPGRDPRDAWVFTQRICGV